MKEKNNNLLPYPKIFPQQTVITSNQQEYRRNHLTEILKQQEDINNTQKANHQKLKNQLMAQANKNNEFHESLLSAVDSTNQIEQKITKLENLMEEDKLISKATIDQLAFQEDLTRGIHTKLEKYEKLYVDIQSRISQQEHFYNEINNKLQIQEMFHQSIMDRLDSQDAATQKVADQLNALKHTLVEKLETAILSIDHKYKQTLHYLAGKLGLKERIIQKPLQDSENQEEAKMVVKQE